VTDQNKYVLMTAAHDEEANIANTIESVVSQSIPPVKWVIVSDNSTDKTDEIVRAYGRRHRWIQLLRRERPSGYSFASKITALHLADPILREEAARFIGNIDADITLESDYFEQLIGRLDGDPRLGVASGFVHERSGTEYVSRPLNSEQSVPHAAQLMRWDCYDSIGGYRVLKYGGEDWHAGVSANMKGWQVRAFPDLKILHHRPSLNSGRAVMNAFRAGRMDYSFGSYGPFEVLKCMRRMPEAHFTGGFVRMLGFMIGYVFAEERQVSIEFMRFLRNEQRQRVASFIKRPFRRRVRLVDSETHVQ
jgi:poly-beta-1,6-N-acetyl-D-glucosamine synthase